MSLQKTARATAPLPPDAPRACVNARLLDPASGLDAHGALLVKDGRIADISSGGLDAATLDSSIAVLDCGGLCLAPGLVDLRAALREPGAEHKETIASGAYAAATGGVTTLLCTPDTEPAVDNVGLVGFVQRRAREAGTCKIHPCAALTRERKGLQLTDMGLLQEAGAVAFTDCGRALASAGLMRQALAYAQGFDLLVMQHAEEPSLAAFGVMHEGELATRLGLSGIPDIAEAMLLERDLTLLSYFETPQPRYHACHLSTAQGLLRLRRAREEGLNITCDTAPPYFLLTEHAVSDYRSYARLSPPLRPQRHRRAVLEALCDGTIDAIASDHAPHDRESKRLPFEQAASGAIGLETLLPLTLNLYHEGHMSLLDALAKITCNPANIARLPAGALKKGAFADIVVFDPQECWVAESESFASKSHNTPFHGFPMQGRAVHTLVNGRPVFSRAKQPTAFFSSCHSRHG